MFGIDCLSAKAVKSLPCFGFGVTSGDRSNRSSVLFVAESNNEIFFHFDFSL
jgi:hypothetical protein